MNSKSAQKEKLNHADIAGQMWLSYYNRVLYEQGLISERERNLMAVRIRAWRASSLPDP